MKCPVCRSQSVADSDVAAARAIRLEIARLVEDGRSGDQIRDIDRRSPTARTCSSPRRATGFAGLVWILPVVALVVALAALSAALRSVASTAGPHGDRRRPSPGRRGPGAPMTARCAEAALQDAARLPAAVPRGSGAGASGRRRRRARLPSPQATTTPLAPPPSSARSSTRRRTRVRRARSRGPSHPGRWPRGAGGVGCWWRWACWPSPGWPGCSWRRRRGGGTPASSGRGTSAVGHRAAQRGRSTLQRGRGGRGRGALRRGAVRPAHQRRGPHLQGVGAVHAARRRRGRPRRRSSTPPPPTRTTPTSTPSWPWSSSAAGWWSKPIASSTGSTPSTRLPEVRAARRALRAQVDAALAQAP